MTILDWHNHIILRRIFCRGRHHRARESLRLQLTLFLAEGRGDLRSPPGAHVFLVPSTNTWRYRAESFRLGCRPVCRPDNCAQSGGNFCRVRSDQVSWSAGPHNKSRDMPSEVLSNAATNVLFLLLSSFQDGSRETHSRI